LRDGRIVRAQGYMDRAAALRAAGLSEQDGHAES
jgi:ketosteroid isomerase-like protein